MDRTKDDLEHSIKMLSGELEALKEQNYAITVESAKKEDKINQMKNRKLTLKERFSGKIIENKDEDKRI
jgi:FtsZ-binding cell division protein ZapB